MLLGILALVLINASLCERMQTSYHLMHVDEMEMAAFDDAQHRGPNWYDYSVMSKGDGTSIRSEASDSEIQFSSYGDKSETVSKTSMSSEETTEAKIATRKYRACTTCPHDMLKKYTNIGIKWICAGYQRARRTFKSVCMMRYRNCEDGTMFVKLHDYKCKNDTYHGKNFFYDYKV